MYVNYKELGRDTKARNMLYYGFAGSTLFYFIIISLFPEPNTSYGIAIAAAGYIYVQFIQGDMLKAHKEHGGAFQSLWKALGVALVSLLLMVVLVVVQTILIG